VRLRSLLPEPGELETDELARRLGLGERAPADRPYLIANMVSSVDGRATVEGRSGPMGGEPDRALFHALRASVDAVMAGTGTIAVENYGRLVRDAGARARREAAGLAADPLLVVASRSGRLPWDAPCFSTPEQRVAVWSGRPVMVPETAPGVEVEVVDDGDVVATAVRGARERHGVRSLLCEGGPVLLGALLDKGLVDELFLTVAPVLAGPGERPIVDGESLRRHPALALESLLESEGALFARYRVL
jgi:riboflavin biosynthesis pyrimidine reductase